MCMWGGAGGGGVLLHAPNKQSMLHSASGCSSGGHGRAESCSMVDVVEGYAWWALHHWPFRLALGGGGVLLSRTPPGTVVNTTQSRDVCAACVLAVLRNIYYSVVVQPRALVSSGRPRYPHTASHPCRDFLLPFPLHPCAGPGQLVAACGASRQG